MSYFVVNKTTGEEVEVLYHTAGDGVAQFVKAELAGTPDWETTTDFYTFANPNKDGEFTQPESGQLDVTGEWDFIQK